MCLNKIINIPTNQKEEDMAFRKSASEHNVYLAYSCMDNVTPNSAFNKFGSERGSEYDYDNENEDDDDSETIRLEKSRGLYDLSGSELNKNPLQVSGSEVLNVPKSKPLCDLIEIENNRVFENLSRTEINKKTPRYNNTGDETSDDENYQDNQAFQNPNILRLTKMKWLTEHGGVADSSPGSSATTLSSLEDSEPSYMNDRPLATILRLDREHNLFGLSHITLDASQPIKTKLKRNEKPVFPTTAIIQIACCASKCCRHQSRTDFPVSLKCGPCLSVCGSCCVKPSCRPGCRIYSCNPCGPINCCKTACRGTKCKSIKCRTDDTGSCGLTISVTKRPKYKPEPILITPKASCVLAKPLAARACTHCPPCQPPSSCFPYLMPCFWPSRPSAPCTASKCFHNPKCQPAKCPKLPAPYLCPTHKKCTNTDKPCNNSVCAMYDKTPEDFLQHYQPTTAETKSAKKEKKEEKKKQKQKQKDSDKFSSGSKSP